MHPCMVMIRIAFLCGADARAGQEQEAEQGRDNEGAEGRPPHVDRGEPPIALLQSEIEILTSKTQSQGTAQLCESIYRQESEIHAGIHETRQTFASSGSSYLMVIRLGGKCGVC